jgi:hypothetical protein
MGRKCRQARDSGPQRQRGFSLWNCAAQPLYGGRRNLRRRHCSGGGREAQQQRVVAVSPSRELAQSELTAAGLLGRASVTHVELCAHTTILAGLPRCWVRWSASVSRVSAMWRSRRFHAQRRLGGGDHSLLGCGGCPRRCRLRPVDVCHLQPRPAQLRLGDGNQSERYEVLVDDFVADDALRKLDKAQRRESRSTT